jgi:hypothetical protein
MNDEDSIEREFLATALRRSEFFGAVVLLSARIGSMTVFTSCSRKG